MVRIWLIGKVFFVCNVYSSLKEEADIVFNDKNVNNNQDLLGTADDKNKQGKKKRGPTLQELIPLNLFKEKEKFYAMNHKYNPQFVYSFDRLKPPYKRPHILLLKCAKSILEATISKFGSDENYYNQFGRYLSREETCVFFDNYIKSLNLEGTLFIFNDDLLDK